MKANVDVIVVDSAHGHSENILRAVREIKAAYPGTAGYRRQRCYRAPLPRLEIDAGVDAVGWYRTWFYLAHRVVAGIGVPQITAVMVLCCKVCPKRYGIPIIAELVVSSIRRCYQAICSW